MGVIHLVFKIYREVHAYCEKSVLVIQYDLTAIGAKTLMNESLETRLHCQSLFGWIYLTNIFHFWTDPQSKTNL